VAVGAMPAAGTIDAPIARDPRNPLKFRTSTTPAAKEARTHFRRIEAVEDRHTMLSWIACRLETGRTHQIRVHLESIRHPLVGDPLYRRGRPNGDHGAADASAWMQFPRQALHACRLAIVHPALGTSVEWFRAPPLDMRQLMRGIGFGRCDRPRLVFP